jgi:hypothetical protein
MHGRRACDRYVWTELTDMTLATDAALKDVTLAREAAETSEAE